MKYAITLLSFSCCLVFDLLACPGYVPYIDGDPSVHVNTPTGIYTTYTRHADAGYTGAQGGYMDTEWTLSSTGGFSQVVVGGSSKAINFTGVPTGSYTLTARDRFVNASWCYGCISNTTFTFQIVVFPAYPKPTKPVIRASGGTLQAYTATADWAPAVPYADQYDLQWGIYDNFNGPSSTVTSETSYSFDHSKCFDLYVRVRAKAFSGQIGPWSDVSHTPPLAGCRIKAPADVVTIGNSSDEDEMVEESGPALVFPNPSDRYFNFILPHEMDKDRLQLAVHSVSGAEMTLPHTVVGRKLEVDAAQAPSGMYILMVTDGNRVLTLKALRK